MNIGIDLDDVVVDFMGPFTAICNKRFGKPELHVLPVDWEWTNFGLSKGEISIAWEIAQGTYNFWENLPVEPGVDSRKLRALDRNHNVFFITARVPSLGDPIKDQSGNWLRNTLGIQNPTVFVTTNKGPLAAALKLDYFIDDRPKNILEVKASVPTCRMFLKDSSHNQPFHHPDVIRIDDLNEFMSTVESVCEPDFG